jgi:hypothetical protein
LVVRSPVGDRNAHYYREAIADLELALVVMISIVFCVVFPLKLAIVAKLVVSFVVTGSFYGRYGAG